MFNDLYPIRNPPSESRTFIEHYVKCLDDDVRQAGGRPLWITAQSIHYRNELRDPTPSEIRVQAWLSLAHGATGLIFFDYNRPDSCFFDGSGTKTESLREMGKVMESVGKIAPLLQKVRLAKLAARAPDYLDMQSFVDDGGAKYLMVVNKDVNLERSFSLIFDQTKVTRATDKNSGENLQIQYVGGKSKLDISLAPGDGQLMEIVE